MQTPAQQIEQIFRDKLAKIVSRTDVHPNSKRETIVLAQLDMIEVILIDVFGYTDDKINDILEEVRNQQNNA